jgi:hypothetical protein
MLQYDESEMPLLVTGASALIARWAPRHMVATAESLHARSEDERLRSRVADQLLAFRGFVHRCEVALRRLEGETSAVDPAVTADDGDMESSTKIAMREPILAVMRSSIEQAGDFAAMHREMLVPYAGRPLDSAGRLEADSKTACSILR